MLAERIQRSMELLEHLRPGCLDKVNLATLDMADPKLCVAGQTVGFGVLVDHIAKLGSLDDVNQHYAFAASDTSYAVLNAEWRSAIRQRKG